MSNQTSTIEAARVLITTASTFKAFVNDNNHLTVTELQAQWRSIQRVRQDGLKAQLEHGKASGVTTFKTMGRVRVSDGTINVAAIVRCRATSAQIASDRAKHADSAAKRDAKLASLLVDAPETFVPVAPVTVAA
jgi:hypothetical protein